MLPDGNKLVERYLAGEKTALDELIRVYTGPLYGFVFLLVHERDTVEDILQDTFLKVWRGIGRFDQRQSFRTWLYTIAKNTSFDYLKKKKTFSFSSLDEENMKVLESYPDESFEILDRLSKEERIQALESALQEMPEIYKALLVLVYREDFDLREVAQILNEPYNTIKSRHQRGVKLLKEIVGNASQKQAQSY